MYIHIGNNYMICEENIIGIFNIENCKMQEIKRLVDNQYIFDISEGKQKSFILIKEKEELKAYISHISSVTLSKR